MSCCSIFNQSFLSNADFSTAVVDIAKLKSFIPSFDENTSGLWKPIVIYSRNSTMKYGDLLSQPDSTLNPSFNPCSCSTVINSYDEVESEDTFRCSYCSSLDGNKNHKVSWRLKDLDNNVSSTLSSVCCSGACDIRMDKDDYLPKVPILNQKYLDQFYDFKHMKQFPAVGASLGFEKFVKFTSDTTRSLQSFYPSAPELCIDWELKPRIAEIPYDVLTSQYDNIDDHNKAYKKHLQTGSTCGNFILTKLNNVGSDAVLYYSDNLFNGLMGEDSYIPPDTYPLPDSNVSDDITTVLPSIEDFNNLPYGFSKNTYNNIFIKTEKLASYWKWNYSSGIIGWYRYYDKDRLYDGRPIPGIDLYISPGDVFYAKNDGPEPLANSGQGGGNQIINTCPSGIKVIKDATVLGVIPSGSSFTYISANLYPIMRDIYDRIDKADRESIFRPNSMTTLQKFELAALLSTAPQYDAVTVDLLKTKDLYSGPMDGVPDFAKPINEHRQRNKMNRDMSTSEIDSISHMNFISSEEELIHTLANKYGSYLWCPPNTTSKLKLLADIDSQAYIDLSFDMVVKISDTRGLLGGCSLDIDCYEHLVNKKFSYDQTIQLGNLKIASKTNTRKRYDSVCNNTNGVRTTTKSANMAGIFLNDHLLKELVYSTGCSVFQNTYPRPLLDNNPNIVFCSSCEDGSSYKLALGINNILCSGFEGNSSFCDEPSARFANNSEGLIEGTRPGRTIYDGSLYHTRKYNAAIMNPRIDKAAFHHQGGVYYDSKIFGANNSTVFSKNVPILMPGECSITFTTNDVGIKIYGLQIEKLRGSDPNTYECLGFPNKNECQCFPINTITDYPYICTNDSTITYSNDPILFTPNLSTTYGPTFKAYGGYSQDDILYMLEDHRIPHHPSVGSSLSSLNEKIDPEKPYGCSQSVSATFPNYLKTEWNFSLPSYNTIHADIWAEVIENVDLFKTTSYSQTFDDDGNLEWTPSPNIGYQRFATRVTLNDTTLYDKQKKVFIEKGGGSSSYVKATLLNPYLEAIAGEDPVLYPPIGNFCTTNTVFGGLGDQSIDLSIKFSRIPRKQILNFAIPAPKQMGILKKGFFHPNTGLRYNGDDTKKTSVVRDSNTLTSYIDYDKELFRPDYPFEEGKILIGEMNDKLKEALRQIGEINNHKKLRLYVKVDNQWWEYNDPNIFGYFKENQKYIGQPYLFEYTRTDNTTNLPGPILPVSPKLHLGFNFFYNFTYPGSNTTRPNAYYPITNTKFVRKKDKTKIVIEGSRPYFLIAEYKENNNIDRLHTKFTELHINYNRKNILNYVYGTKKSCDQKVVIFSSDNSSLSYVGRIIEKSIYTVYVDKYGNKLKASDNTKEKYIKIYTEFVLDSKVKYFRGYLDLTFLSKIPRITLDNRSQWPQLFDDSEEEIINGVDSLIIYQDIATALKSESDPLLKNTIYGTKWGDLIDFDSRLTNELGQYIYNTGYLHDFYPDSLYKNLFFKTMINNCNNNMYNYNFKIIDSKGRPKDFLINYFGQTSYTIHQKYNIGDGNNSIVRKNFRDNNNYLSFMDINFLPDYGLYQNFGREDFKPLLKELLQAPTGIYPGIVQISGIYKNLDANYKWPSRYLNPNDKKLFFIDLQKRNLFKSALTIKKDQTFYTNTLRVDDVPFQLYSIESNSVINNLNTRRVFTPAGPTATTTFPPVTFDFNHFYKIPYTGTPFIRMPVYGDTDRVEGCDSVGCGINTIGAVSFSGIYHIQVPLGRDILSDLNDIPYIISYDAGLYNPIGNKELYYIQRIELDPNNTLYPATNCDNLVSPRPTINRISVLNEEYQSIMRNNIVSDHTDIVNKTDIFANEMLFRSIYGEKQKINLKTIDDHTSQIIKFNDLIKYTDPKIQAKDIYRNIPYDLDTTAPSNNRKINGSLSIQGILQIGKTVSITIGNKNISISIVRDNEKIKIVSSVDGKTMENIIHREYIITNNLVVSDRVLASNGSTEYVFKRTCVELANNSVGFMSATPKGVYYNTFKCDGTRGDLQLPYWTSSKPCTVGSWRPGMDDPGCNPDYGSPPRYVVQYRPSNACLGAAIIDTPDYSCNNMGVGYSINDLIGSAPCSVIATTGPKTIKLGRYARGTFTGCYAEGSINGQMLFSSLESLIGGRIIAHPIGIPSRRSYSEPSCGTCFTDNYEEPTTKNNYYGAINGRSFPPGPGDTGNHCDCEDWEYGYCQATDNGRCACNPSGPNSGGPADYDYQDFDYNFEYCRYQISLKAHKRRLKYPSKDGRITTPLPICDGYNGDGIIGGPIGQIGGEVTEECAWIECQAGDPATWRIYDAISRSQPIAYEALCPSQLCSINYDNNSLTINLPSGPSFCISHEIRGSCPLVRVVVPDDSFTVSDSISSSCDTCGAGSDKITMTPQTQSWDIITETRTCILGSFLSSADPNDTGFHTSSVQTIGCGYCNACSAVACGPQTYTQVGNGQCGKEAPDSFPWSTCISFGGPQVCIGGTSRYPSPIVAGCDIPISFPASNRTASARMLELWKEKMDRNLKNVAPCFNNIDMGDGLGVGGIQDIVEGVVPGSCSSLLTTNISYPAIKYRATLSNPVVESLTVTYTVAYYTYQYRRPRTIQDIFKKDVRAKCDSLKGSCPPATTINTTEIYKTADCSSSPGCYNTDIPSCDDTNYCCKAGLKNDV
jgi:hypothetical protein